MATEAPFIVDGSQTQAGANLWNPGTALAGPQGSGQFLVVMLTGSRTVNIATGPTVVPYGVLQNTPALGQAASCAILGVCKCVAGAALASAGTLLMIDSSGRVITWVAGAANYVIGQNIETASGINVIVTVQLMLGPGIS